jgi:NTP pyrophosphatase (non-canonical NTP hydrolase)
MERVLKENDHKGGWNDIQALVLLNQLKEETTELADAIENDTSPEHVIKEATDVANFAMMIADNARTDR